MVLETTTDKTSEILSACRVQLGGEDRMIPSKGFPRFPMCLLTKIQSMFPGSVGPSPRLGTAVLTPNTDVDTFKCLHHPPVLYHIRHWPQDQSIPAAVTSQLAPSDHV